MSIQDTLCFADFDPVTGVPTVNGFTGIHDPFVITSESDAGYVLGSRLTFDSSSGFPPVIFQGVKNGNFLNFAFFCRLDLSFDLQDVVVMALRPRVSNPAQGTARRLDIFPVYEAVGADEELPATGGPAGTPDDTPPGVPPGVNYHIRTNHAAQEVNHYRGQLGVQQWTTLNPDGTTYNPSNISVKTRSWQPPVPTKTTSVGAQTLPTATFNVVNTSEFPAQGLFAVGGQIVQYTGKTGTSFTGCTGGSGPIPNSSGVSIPEVAWSIEVQLPLSTASGGASWINIEDSFGLYFAVIRVGKTPASGSTSSQGWYATEFLFPVGTMNFLIGALNETTSIDPTWYGTGLIPALQTPPGSNLGLGVRFVNGEFGVGVRNANAAAGSPFGNQIRGASNPTPGDNRLVAHVQNTGPTAANNVTVEFRFANWGLGPPSFPSWALASGATSDTPSGVSIPGSGNSEITWTWPKAAVPPAYSPPHDHQCTWVQLNSTMGVNFTQSSVRRNIDFVNLSEVARPATISGVGYPAPASGSHDFLLMTYVRYFEARWLRRRPPVPGGIPPNEEAGDNTVYWLWIVHGYRRTGQTITIAGQDFEILDETPGAFGSITQHEGLTDVFTYELSGGGIQHMGGNVYALPVPHNGSVEIHTRIAANPPDPWWLRCLKAPLRALHALLRLIRGNP